MVMWLMDSPFSVECIRKDSQTIGIQHSDDFDDGKTEDEGGQLLDYLSNDCVNDREHVPHYFERFKILTAPRITKAKTMPPTIKSGHLLSSQ